MLTLLYLVHRWFYLTPKSHPLSYLQRKVLRVNLPTEETESVDRIANKTPKEFALCKCEPGSGTDHFAKVSATTVLAGAHSPRRTSNGNKMSIEERFRAAVRVIHSLPKDGPYQPSNTTKLKFYGLFKQATEGKNETAKPPFWDVVGRAKWQAWDKLDDMTKENSMQLYVDGLKEIVETMSFSGDVEDFLDSIGPFYEFVTLQGNEMNHIKEKIEEFSSSNSSLANSIAASAENSKENSPVKTLENGVEEDEEEEEEVSTSEKAEVMIATSSAVYETKGHHHKGSQNQNGNAFKMTNGANPPPAPRHSYSQQNGNVKYALPNENDEDDVLTVSTSYNNVSCKEDLEWDEVGKNDNRKVKVTSSFDTVATSGTEESEKYYSGDSEPEMDEKYATFLANKDAYPCTSSTALALAHTGSDANQNNLKKSIISNPIKKSCKERVSPKTSACINTAADLATQETIERINRDVEHILARLRILEAAYATNAEGAIRASSNQGGVVSRRRRRIFGDLSPQSIAFIVIYPFAIQFILKLIRWWWRRRRNVRSITN